MPYYLCCTTIGVKYLLYAIVYSVLVKLMVQLSLIHCLKHSECGSFNQSKVLFLIIKNESVKYVVKLEAFAGQS